MEFEIQTYCAQFRCTISEKSFLFKPCSENKRVGEIFGSATISRSCRGGLTGEVDSQDSRPELNRLIADANCRRFDAVAVWEFDRFARSVSYLLRALETFRTLGIEFVSLSESIATSTPTGKMVFTVLASAAELGRTLIGERVRAGIRNAKAGETRFVRPPLKDLSVTEIQRFRRERRRSTVSFKGLAAKYGVDSVSAVQKGCSRVMKLLR